MSTAFGLNGVKRALECEGMNDADDYDEDADDDAGSYDANDDDDYDYDDNNENRAKRSKVTPPRNQLDRSGPFLEGADLRHPTSAPFGDFQENIKWAGLGAATLQSSFHLVKTYRI